DARARGRPLLRGADRAQLDRQRTGGAARGNRPARARHGRGRGAAGGDDRRHGTHRLRHHARVRADRGLRPGRGGREAHRLGGQNISSLEVEDALYRHPAVLACAVVAKADAKWGETPLAYVETKPDAAVTADELVAHCRALLAGYKVPREIRFEPIPKTSTGK